LLTNSFLLFTLLLLSKQISRLEAAVAEANRSREEAVTQLQGELEGVRAALKTALLQQSERKAKEDNATQSQQAALLDEIEAIKQEYVTPPSSSSSL
jgi:hypothetical protein